MSSSFRGRRGPSGPWGRLKPVTMDPLESVGLPSKGDNRLLDFKTQETYYNQIVSRYMKFCGESTDRNELEKAFSSLSLNTNATGSPPAASHTSSPSVTPPSLAQRTLSVLLLAMRKLREGLVATHRHDAFATSCYTFLIRTSILLAHPPSYSPALPYLLYVLHPASPLPTSLLNEFLTYVILDLACRQNRLADAYAVRQRHGLKDRKLDRILKSIVQGDWVDFWKVREEVDGYMKKLMEEAEKGMRVLALKCLGRAYISIDRAFLDKATGGVSWEVLRQEYGVGWDLEDGGKKVVIRKPKGGGG